MHLTDVVPTPVAHRTTDEGGAQRRAGHALERHLVRQIGHWPSMRWCGTSTGAACDVAGPVSSSVHRVNATDRFHLYHLVTGDARAPVFRHGGVWAGPTAARPTVPAGGQQPEARMNAIPRRRRTRAIRTPRAAAVAGIVFSVLFATSVVLLEWALPPGSSDTGYVGRGRRPPERRIAEPPAAAVRRDRVPVVHRRVARPHRVG